MMSSKGLAAMTGAMRAIRAPYKEFFIRRKSNSTSCESATRTTLAEVLDRSVLERISDLYPVWDELVAA
jgi:hypothetical protein